MGRNGKRTIACHSCFLPRWSSATDDGKKAASDDASSVSSCVKEAGSSEALAGGRTEASCWSGRSGGSSPQLRGDQPSETSARSAANGA